MKVRLPLQYVPHRPSPKQLAFLAFDGEEAFYGGAAGGGKTDALLMSALQYIDVPNYSAIILRRSYTDLALSGAIMDRARSWLQDKARWDRETHTFHFPSKASLAFGYIATSADRYRYQSAEYQYIGWDEVTEFPLEEDYTFMFSRLRRTKELAEVPLRMRCASNPVGAGLYWVKKRFIPEAYDREDGIIFNDGRLFVPATFKDNKHLDRENYLKSLKQLHPALQAKLIAGDWDVALDVAFPEFDPEIHVIEPFEYPQEWRRFEAMDFGVSNPTCWLPAVLTPEGDTIVQDEYYSEGLVNRHASVILTMRNNYWGHPLVAVCDPSIQNRTGFGTSGMGETVHSEFSKNGVFLVPANNDRIGGRVRISELLHPDPNRPFPVWHRKHGEYGAPRLYFSSKCKNLLQQLPMAPIDEKDVEMVDPYWESHRGHAIAALRYLCTSRVYPAKPGQQERGTDGWRTMREWTDKNNWREM